jgi:hypothetical protein
MSRNYIARYASHYFSFAGEPFLTFVASGFFLGVIFLAWGGMIISRGCGASKFNLLQVLVYQFAMLVTKWFARSHYLV